jgi:O-antigen/teichoic acid export membrane protein
LKNYINTYHGKIKEHKHYANAVHWTKLISITGSAQIMVQGTALVTGIFLVHLLPVKEYAFYTIANTMLGTMTVLADGGISSGVMAEGGKVWKDKTKLGVVLATGIRLRQRFAILSLLVSASVLFYLLKQHDADTLSCVLVILALVPAFLAALSDTIYQIAPKLHQDIKPLQKNQFVVGMLRFLTTTVFVFIFPWTFVALLANGLPRSFGNIQLKGISQKYSDKDQLPDKEVEKSILKVVRRVMPGSIYYCVSGQLTIWILSLYGTTSSLASFGALGRITSVTAIFSTVFATLIIPRFARLPNTKRVLVKSFIIDQIILFVLSLLFIAFVYLFSDQILYVLGSKYQGLNYELLLITISGCMGVISQATNGLLASRGLIIPPFLFIGTTVFIQVGAAFVFPLSKIEGVIFYGMSTIAIIYIIRLVYFYYTLRTHDNL